MSKFLCVYTLPTSIQIRIGKVSKSFSSTLYDNPLKAALKYRQKQFEVGNVPAFYQLNMLTESDLSITRQKKFQRSRCSIKVLETNKPSTLEVYWASYKSCGEAERELKKRYLKWISHYNAVAIAYNKLMLNKLLSQGKEEIDTLEPFLVKGKFDKNIWDIAYRTYLDSFSANTTVKNHSKPKQKTTKTSADSTKRNQKVELEDTLYLDVPNCLPSEDVAQLKAQSDEVLEAYYSAGTTAQTYSKRFSISEVNLKSKVMELDRTLDDHLFFDLVIKRNLIYVSVKSQTDNGLPLIPSNGKFKLDSFDAIINCVYMLCRAKKTYYRYLSLQEKLFDDPDFKLVDFTWGKTEIQANKIAGIVRSLKQALIAKLPKRDLKTRNLCVSRLNMWSVLGQCSFTTSKIGDLLTMEGGCELYMPNLVMVDTPVISKIKTLASFNHFMSLIQVLFVEGQFDNQYITEQVEQFHKLKESKPEPLSKDEVRFRELSNRLFRELNKYHPNVNLKSLNIPKPSKTWLVSCDCCGSVPEKDFYHDDRGYHCIIQCPEQCNPAIKGSADTEVELSKYILEWFVLNVYSLDFKQLYMWNISYAANEHRLGVVLYAIRDYLKEVHEYDALALSLPNNQANYKPTDSKLCRTDILRKWSDFFISAFEDERAFDDLQFQRRKYA
ncbi:hypothetical protein [Vibrio diabolicus]|jgi:hypothetical protein|uniref:hypothetical protein n=1 Tax=Vibrio diabolicus TaxID=50719 RepID=UPI002150E9A1|nr:hypothetical protein [Vibrio diabolicus]UDY85754.1 hypothetical protein LJY22_23605 [Vibrio diabolicus]